MRWIRRITVPALIGIVLLAAGIIGLCGTPGLLQYAFQSAGEKSGEILSRFETLQQEQADIFQQMTIHGVKSGVTLSAGKASREDICLYLTGPGWNEAYPRAYVSGRPVSRGDIDASADVIVLDEATAFSLFGAKDAVGQTVTLGEKKLEVIGVARHRRTVGETNAYAAWAPFGTVEDCDLYVTTAVQRGKGNLDAVFSTAASERFGTGTLISLGKEKSRGLMILRWTALLLALPLMKRWVRFVSGMIRKAAGLIRAEKERRYAGKLILYGIRKAAPAALMTALLIAAGYGMALLAVSPAKIFPEWIPESLGDFSTWGRRFWELTGAAANPVTLKTPELAEIRFWSGLVRWGTVLGLIGTIIGMRKDAGKKEGGKAA